ncbi:hypothetical protein AMECASPLE_020375, partial [Ameca splendens]
PLRMPRQERSTFAALATVFSSAKSLLRGLPVPDRIVDRVHGPDAGQVPALQESVLYWSEVSPEAKFVVLSTLLVVQHFHCWADGWNVGEGSDLPGDLRLVGRHAAPGSGHPGPGLLLGVHEGQPATPELHIEAPLPSSTTSQPNRKEERWLRNRIYIFNPTQLRRRSAPPVPSLLIRHVSKTGMVEPVTPLYLLVTMKWLPA